MNQRADAGDDQHHHHRERVELQRGINVQIADRHPREQRADERHVHVHAAHRHKNHHGKYKRSGQHARPHEADQRGVLVTHHSMIIVPGARAAFLRMIIVTVADCRRIRRPDLRRRRERQQAIHDKSEQRQRRQQPYELRGGLRQRMPRRRRGDCLHRRKKHQPRSTLMFSRFTVCL